MTLCFFCFPAIPSPLLSEQAPPFCQNFDGQGTLTLHYNSHFHVCTCLTRLRNTRKKILKNLIVLAENNFNFRIHNIPYFNVLDNTYTCRPSCLSKRNSVPFINPFHNHLPLQNHLYFPSYFHLRSFQQS